MAMEDKKPPRKIPISARPTREIAKDSNKEWAKPSQNLTVSIKGKLPSKEVIKPRPAKPVGHYRGSKNKDIYIGLTASIVIMGVVFIIILFKDQL